MQRFIPSWAFIYLLLGYHPAETRHAQVVAIRVASAAPFSPIASGFVSLNCSSGDENIVFSAEAGNSNTTKKLGPMMQSSSKPQPTRGLNNRMICAYPILNEDYGRQPFEHGGRSVGLRKL
jgi:hypothetical protein